MTAALLPRLRHRSRDLLFLPWFDAHWRRRLQGRVLCLLYHRVAERTVDDPLAGYGVPPITPQELAAELQFLSRQGARFLRFSDLRAGPFPGPDQLAVIVSFDDGFACNYGAALEVLEALGIAATIFQSSAMLRGNPLIWEHILYVIWSDPSLLAQLHGRLLQQPPWPGLESLSPGALLAALRDRTPLQLLEPLLQSCIPLLGGEAALIERGERLYPSAQQLQQAQASGHEIGSHGHQHLPRHSISPERFSRDLQASHQTLTRILGKPPQAYSYPFNSHLPGDSEICGRLFRQVATVDGGSIGPDTPPLALPRVTWPGPHRNALRRRRWLWTGQF